MENGLCAPRGSLIITRHVFFDPRTAGPALMDAPALLPGKPRHEQISEWLRGEIEHGRLLVDERLPSESQIGEHFGVSRITVRRALQTLEHEGLIYRRQGLGSFVKGHALRQGLVRLTDFVEDMALAGLKASSKVRHKATEAASEAVADALQLEVGTPLVRLDRLRLANNRPSMRACWMGTTCRKRPFTMSSSATSISRF